MSASVRERLRQTHFLDGFPDSALHQLAKLVTPAEYDADAILFDEGSPREFLAIIISGAVAIEKGQEGRHVRLVTLGAGEAVGEGLLLDDSQHGTSARALTNTKAYVLTQEQIQDMLKEVPTLYAALVGRAARAIKQRLSAVDATLVGRGRTLGFGGTHTRSEHDLLGDRDVPDDALYGIQTLRALENFPITGIALREFPDLIEALAAVKEAAATANAELGLLPKDIADVIIRASAEIRSGRHHEHFLVDMIQGGAGTSTNMNVNEVIANRALELSGHSRGEYQFVHPNNHVNLSQSTNDVYPTAVKIALHTAIEDLRKAMKELVDAFLAKGEEFAPFLKMGRTQLQDAVPMTLGQEFGTYAVMLGEDRLRLEEAVTLLHEVNLGATAIGTGLNTAPGYAAAACRHLVEVTGLPLQTSPDLVEATQDCGAFVHLSGVLKRIAVKLSKICNDLRLLSSGPRAGFNEINLPPVQAGSSIMPGKINPVIPEVVNQVAFEVIGNDVTVTMAAEAGQLQLNAFEPIILHSLGESITHLTAACRVLTDRCVKGITANPDVTRGFVENSIGLATALNPAIGYAAATEIAKEALATGRGVAELVLDRKLIPAERLEEMLRPENLAHPRG